MDNQLKQSITALENLKQSWLDSQVVLHGQNCDIDLGEHLTNVLTALGAAIPAPASDEVLAELEQALEGFPRVFVAKGLEIGTVAGWRIAKMNGNKSDDLFAKSISKVWNVAPALLARVRSLQAFKDYVHGRFDDAGIKKHEEQNAINGCRVGSRFDDLLACARSQNELLDSMGQTNRVLAQRLKSITDALPGIAKNLTDAVREADAESEGQGDGYEACYNEADNAAAALRKLLRELNPTVKGAQQDE